MSRLYGRIGRGIDLGTQRVVNAADKLKLDLQASNALHVAGTNGKGSVCAMTACACRRAGYRVGMFTSPHLHHFAERIQVQGAPIPDQLLSHCLQLSLDTSEDLTFFEVAFLAAMVAFAEQEVDVIVLEVGMGGRFDATNAIIAPLATAVTSVALDHQQWLGNSLEGIAMEKASIAKPGIPMILGPMPPVARAEATRVAHAAKAAPIIDVSSLSQERSSDTHATHLSLPDSWGHLTLRPRLAGDHQLNNAAVAAVLLQQAARKLSALTPQHIQQGVELAQWPGRFEVIRGPGGTRFILDGAHNPAAAQALRLELVNSQAKRPDELALVFGAMEDKDWKTSLDILRPITGPAFFVEPGGRTPAPATRLASYGGGKTCSNVVDALREARLAVAPGGTVVVCGSLFLVSEARQHLLGIPTGRPPVAM